MDGYGLAKQNTFGQGRSTSKHASHPTRPTNHQAPSRAASESQERLETTGAIQASRLSAVIWANVEATYQQLKQKLLESNGATTT